MAARGRRNQRVTAARATGPHALIGEDLAAGQGRRAHAFFAGGKLHARPAHDAVGADDPFSERAAVEESLGNSAPAVSR